MTTWSHKSAPAFDIGGGTLVVAAAWLAFYLVATVGGAGHDEARHVESPQYMVSPDSSLKNQDTTILPVQKFYDMTFVFSDDDTDPTPTASLLSASNVSSVGAVKRAAELQEDR